MFGKNPIRKQDLSSPNQLWIQEVFPTIQGEGPFAGQGATFVRVGGCNLRCFWCDTDFESSTWHPHTDDLINAVIKANERVKTRLVVFTGGEPFRQDISVVVQRLIEDFGYQVQIETNGTLWIDRFDFLMDRYMNTPHLTIICSPKAGRVHKKIETHAAAYKYIVSANDADPLDGLPRLSTQVPNRMLHLARPPKGMPVYVQPLDAYDEEKNAANEKHAIDLVNVFGYRLSYQIHKHLGLP